MFATLLMLYRNYEKRAGLNTQVRLHQQPRKDPVNRLRLQFQTGATLKYFLENKCCK
jgi:hypothetical protein